MNDLERKFNLNFALGCLVHVCALPLALQQQRQQKFQLSEKKLVKLLNHKLFFFFVSRLPVFPPWSRPGPEPIPPQWPWQEIPPPPPNPQFPSFPNINLPIQTTQAPPLTHPPQPTRPAP